MKSPVRKIAFVSPHCIVRYTDGEATAARDGLCLLAEQGFDCRRPSAALAWTARRRD